MGKINKIRILIVFLLLLVIILRYGFHLFPTLPFFGQIILYFFLGLNNDKLSDKIFIFFISVIGFTLFNNVSLSEWFYLKMFLLRQFSIFFISFLMGIILSKLKPGFRAAIFVGWLPIILDLIVVSIFRTNPFLTVFILYSIIPFLFFYFTKISNMATLSMFILPFVMYFIFGFFAYGFDNDAIKLFLVSIILVLIVTTEFYFVEYIKTKFNRVGL